MYLLALGDLYLGGKSVRIDPSWGEPIEQFLTTGATKAVVCAILSVGWCI